MYYPDIPRDYSVVFLVGIYVISLSDDAVHMVVIFYHWWRVRVRQKEARS